MQAHGSTPALFNQIGFYQKHLIKILNLYVTVYEIHARQGRVFMKSCIFITLIDRHTF